MRLLNLTRQRLNHIRCSWRIDFGPCVKYAAFFFDFRNRTIQRFPRLFGKGDNGDSEGDEGTATPDGLGVYGWFHIIESLADRDITKFDAVTERRCYEVFTHLTYLADYVYVQKMEMKKRNR